MVNGNTLHSVLHNLNSNLMPCSSLEVKASWKLLRNKYHILNASGRQLIIRLKAQFLISLKLFDRSVW